tara:strand:- start:783 stop:1052 length:270 start_codon:yes stop_codon:yes gene_type:complete
MSTKIYAIIKLGDIGLIDFSQVAESSVFTVRKNLDDTQFVIKWIKGYEPTFITDGKIEPLEVLSHAECLELMQTSDWSAPLEEKKEAKK